MCRLEKGTFVWSFVFKYEMIWEYIRFKGNLHVQKKYICSVNLRNIDVHFKLLYISQCNDCNVTAWSHLFYPHPIIITFRFIQLHNASRIYLNMTFLHNHIFLLSYIFGAWIPLLLIRQWKKRAGNRICKGPRVGNWTLVNGSVVTLHVSAPTTRLSAPTLTVTFNRIGIIFIWIFVSVSTIAKAYSTHTQYIISIY